MANALTESQGSTPPEPPAAAAHISQDDLNPLLSGRLCQLHDQLLELVPCVDRIACVLYDDDTDLLKTFVNSTRRGEAIKGYEFHLQESPSLSAIASSGTRRVIDDIQTAVQPTSPHSSWLLEQGYRSSLTVPLTDQDRFIGFVFYNSCQPAAFTPVVERNLALFTRLINMMISSELNSVRSILASVLVARDFADLRDFETGAHLSRMAHYSRLIARDLAPLHGLDDEFIEHIYLFAPLHDIGKIGIPDRILLKPGKLDPEERRLMETHVDLGLSIIDKMLGEFALQDLPDSHVLRAVTGSHHEMLDGSGYPRGLRGEQVPLAARIIAVADVFDALTSQRPYKPAWSVAEACAELDRLVAAGKLDGDCVAAIKRHTDELTSIGARHQEESPEG
ncbi:HD domain-containing phosphohydrolase [Synechococcus sp. CS-1328]|uniref:HD domain-containing phosphohydrolase n=1 Tax=Synechococcus sp. CS-1328 TaxID=2847976 RepID=UPI00223C0FE1|nr:HD domain-containing phosphohydrolase [Synechococcus sp. CS-1328]MCT0224768.1 HD domain-containing protein [Synechococcus sp. CS-1328]